MPSLRAPSPATARGMAAARPSPPLSDAAKVNLVLHLVLDVLSFMRRTAKFAAVFASPSAPTLSPSPYTATNAAIAAGLDPPSSAAVLAGSSSSSSGGVGNALDPSVSASPHHGNSASAGALPSSSTSPGSAQRAEYLDRCARLFEWAGQPPVQRIGTPVTRSVSMDDLDLESSPAHDQHHEHARPTIHVADPHPHHADHAAPAIGDGTTATAPTTVQQQQVPEAPRPPQPGAGTANPSHIPLPASVLVHGFEELLKRLTTLPTPSHLTSRVSPLFLVTPFLRVLQSGDIPGTITAAALSALEQLVAHGLVRGGNGKEQALAVTSLVSTVAHAQIESSDQATDDLVLYRLLALATGLVTTPPLRAYLSDEAVCELTEMGLSVWMSGDAAELVRRKALELLEAIVDTVFGPPLGPAIPSSPTAVTIPTSPDTTKSAVALFTAVCRIEILKALNNIVTGTPTTSSEASVVLALHLFQRLVQVTADPAVHESLVEVAVLPCLALLDAAATTPTLPNHSNDMTLGVGIMAPADHREMEGPTVNVLVMTWQTLQAIWTHVGPRMSVGILGMIFAQLLTYPSVAGTSIMTPVAARGGGAATPSAGAPDTPAADEPWEVRQARLALLRQIAMSAPVLVALYAQFDCHPDRANMHKQLVAYHCALLDATGTQAHAQATYGLDFLQFYLMTLNATQSRVDKAQRAAREHKAVLRQALDLFWSSPKKGIDFLVRQGALPGNAETHPADVARFMFETPGIDKASIGDYIARPSYAPLLAAYMAQFDFSGLRIDQALRKMMLKFRLPGESQMIDRVLECFARHFFQQNPNQDEIADVDAGFILAFSIIMLNTDQHNPQVRNRMNVDSFCRNLRGLNHSADFDRAFLEEVFTAIHHEEIIDTNSLEDRFAAALADSETLHGLNADPTAADTEAMLRSVFSLVLEGLLACTEPRVLACLSLLAQQHECSEALLAKLAGLNQLSPIAGALSGRGSSTASVSGGAQPSTTAPSSGGNGSSSPSSTLKRPLTSTKPKLNHTHLILFFSTVYHQRTGLADAAREHATTGAPNVFMYAMHALATLFTHDLLPDAIMDYYDPIRARKVRVPMIAAGGDTAVGTDGANGTGGGGVGADGRAVSPSNSGSTRAGSSLFSFISYLSTSFANPEPLNEEDRLVKDVLAQCRLMEIMAATRDIGALMQAAVNYPALSAFFTLWIVVAVEGATDSDSPKSKEAVVVVAQLREHLLPLLTATPQLAVAAAVRIGAKWPALLADDMEFGERIAAAVPNLGDMLANPLPISSSSASSPPPGVVSSLALVPYLSPAVFLDAFRKSRTADHAALLLEAYLPRVPHLSDEAVKDLIMLLYRLLIRASSTAQVTALTCAALAPAVYVRTLQSHDPAVPPNAALTFIEYLKLFAIVALNPTVPDARTLAPLTAALFAADTSTSSSTADVAGHPVPVAHAVLVPAIMRDVLVPLVKQFGALLGDAERHRDRAHAAATRRQCADDHARVTVLLVKYLVRRLGDLVPSAKMQPPVQLSRSEMSAFAKLWEQVLDVVLGVMRSGGESGTAQETVLPALENAILVMHATGLFTDASAPARTNALWTHTWAKVSKALPNLAETVVPLVAEQQRPPQQVAAAASPRSPVIASVVGAAGSSVPPHERQSGAKAQQQPPPMQQLLPQSPRHHDHHHQYQQHQQQQQQQQQQQSGGSPPLRDVPLTDPVPPPASTAAPVPPPSSSLSAAAPAAAPPAPRKAPAPPMDDYYDVMTI